MPQSSVMSFSEKPWRLGAAGGVEDERSKLNKPHIYAGFDSHEKTRSQKPHVVIILLTAPGSETKRAEKGYKLGFSFLPLHHHTFRKLKNIKRQRLTNSQNNSPLTTGAELHHRRGQSFLEWASKAHRWAVHSHSDPCSWPTWTDVTWFCNTKLWSFQTGELLLINKRWKPAAQFYCWHWQDPQGSFCT